MIRESSYWKDDLIKTASRLERRLIQTRWSEKNIYTLEKEIFIGFYSVRKLIESNKVSDSLKYKWYEIKEFPYKGNPESIITHFKEEDYDLTSAKNSKISVWQLCNQFIHSHHFLPFLANGKNLLGFLFCSDHKRTNGIFLITLFDIVDIFIAIGGNYPNSIHTRRLPNGKVVSKIE